jgi:hypothetical protein
MAVEVEYFHNSIPYGLTVKYFSHKHTLDVSRGSSVELVNNVFEFVYVTHSLSFSALGTSSNRIANGMV